MNSSPQHGSFSQPPTGRRAFLCTLVRYPLLAALAVVGGALTWRRQLIGEGAECARRGVCRGCSLVSHCALPPAVQARQS